MTDKAIKELVKSNLHLTIDEARKFFFNKSSNNKELYIALMMQWRKNKNTTGEIK